MRARIASILEFVRTVDGWLADEEACLLIFAVRQAVRSRPQAPNIVEVGSYCGKSTAALGLALRDIECPPGTRIFAVDPHEGMVGARDREVYETPRTLAAFRQNMSAAALNHLVEVVPKHSFEVEWDRPICFLFIDGLHDYENVSRDFSHFNHWLVPGGYIAFHDYGPHFPGVKQFVDELLARRGYRLVRQVLTAVVVQKLNDVPVEPGSPTHGSAEAVD